MALIARSRLSLQIRRWGQRHAGYGVVNAHYDIVGEALIWTLGRGLGDGFTDDVKNAWLTAYTLLAGTMKGRCGGG